MSQVPQIKARVVAYKERLVMVPKNPEQDITDKGERLWVPTGGKNGNNLGCVLGNSKTMLGISAPALKLMELVKRNRDCVGDLGWWKCDAGNYAFSWWGPLYRIVNPYTCEGDRDWAIHHDQYIKIVNQVPAKAKAVIDAFVDGEKEPAHWDTPFAVKYELDED